MPHIIIVFIPPGAQHRALLRDRDRLRIRTKLLISTRSGDIRLCPSQTNRQFPQLRLLCSRICVIQCFCLFSGRIYPVYKPPQIGQITVRQSVVHRKARHCRQLYVVFYLGFGIQRHVIRNHIVVGKLFAFIILIGAVCQLFRFCRIPAVYVCQREVLLIIFQQLATQIRKCLALGDSYSGCLLSHNWVERERFLRRTGLLDRNAQIQCGVCIPLRRICRVGIGSAAVRSSCN